MDLYTRPYAAIKVANNWQDVTTDVVGLDGKSAFKLVHGQQNQTSRISYGTTLLALKNQSNRYNPYNASSDLYGYLNQNIPMRIGTDYVQMNFATPAVNSWGSSDMNVNGIPVGLPWTCEGTATAFNVAAGVGTIVSSGTTGSRYATVGSYGDAEILVKMKVSDLTANPEFGVVVRRMTAAATSIRAYLDTSGGDNIKVIFNGPGGGTIVSTAAPFIIVSGTYYWFHVSAGKRIRVTVWPDGTTEPLAWSHDVHNADPFNFGYPAMSGGAGVFIREGVNTAVLTVDQFECFNPRMHGEIASFVPTADSTNIMRQTDIQVVGVLRRLSVGEQKDLLSPIRREATKATTLQYAAGYWACEDGTNATAPSSGLDGGQPMRVIGEQPAYATSDVISGSAPIMVMTTGGISAILPNTPNTSGVVYYRMVMVHGTTEIANNAVICELYTTGSATRWTLEYGTGGSLQLLAYNTSGTLLDSTVSIGSNVIPGTRFYVSIELVQAGADVNVLVATNKISTDGNSISGGVFTDTFPGITVGSCGGLSVGLNGTLAGCGVGHIGVGNNQQFMFSNNALIGYSGERAGARMARLCAENNLEFYLDGAADQTPILGPQIVGTLEQNLQVAADTDQGILYEPRNALAVGYRTRTMLFRQKAIVVDYSASILDEQLAPTTDDTLTANTVTATRIKGGSVDVTITTGPKNNQQPPNGIGVYRPNPPLNVIPQTDLGLPDIASFRAFIGTWDAPRYPVISINLSRNALLTNQDLRAQLASLCEGDYLQIINPPAWMPPEAVNVMTQGYKDAWGQLMWTFQMNTTPYGPYLVAKTDETDNRVGGGTDMVLTKNTLAAATSLISQSVSGRQKWCTATDDADSPADFPFDVMMSGERITVTAVANGLRDTFTRTVAAGGLGTSDDGHVWSITAGTAAYWSVNGARGWCAVNGLNTEQHATTDIEANYNQEMRIAYLVPVTPTGAAINVGILLRYTDANNYYWCDVQTQTTGVLTLRLIKRVAGVVTVLGTKDITGLSHSSVNLRAIRAQALGSTLRMMVFDPALAETQRWQLTVTDSDFLTNTITKAGIITRLMTGNTNALPVTIEFDNVVAYSPQILTVTRAVNGVSKFNGPGQVIEVLDRSFVGR